MQDTLDLLTHKDAAAFLGITPNTLYQWVHRGIGPKRIIFSKRSVRYDRQELIRFARAKETK